MGTEATAEPRRCGTALALAGLILAVLGGCGTTRMTNTARTGTEQLLLTNAWDQALNQVDFRPLVGVPVFLVLVRRGRMGSL